MHSPNKPLESPRGSDPSKAIPALEPGQKLVGRYELVRRLGEGGMGVVWQAKQITTDKPVAIKLLRSDGAIDLARFLREAKVAAGLTHPNIVQVFDFWEAPAESSESGLVFMVMELLVGEPLSAKLERTGSLSIAETSTLVTSIARALRYSHANGIVHRDLKPDNVFLVTNPAEKTATGEAEELVKVVDFGLAKKAIATSEQTAMTQSGSILGTPLYMAPEMVYGEAVDVRADIWALGIISYQCLVGRTPFEGENFGQVFRAIVQGTFQPAHEAAPNVPLWLSSLVGRMLAQDHNARPSAVEVITILEQGKTIPEARGFEPAGTSAKDAPNVQHTSILPVRTPNATQAFTPSAWHSPVATPMAAAHTPPTYAPSARPQAPVRTTPPPAPRRNALLFGMIAGAILLMGGLGLFLKERHDETPRPTTIELPPAPSSTSAAMPTTELPTPQAITEQAPNEAVAVTTPRHTSAGTPNTLGTSSKPNTVRAVDRSRSTPDSGREPDTTPKAPADTATSNPLQRGRF